MKAGAKFMDCRFLGPGQVQLWYRGGQPHALPGDVPIAKTGVPLDANMDLSLVVSGLRLLPTEAINNIPEAAATTPTPVAIQVTILRRDTYHKIQGCFRRIIEACDL